MEEKPKIHIPVLLSESLSYLKIRPSAVIVDATLGLGGHSQAILEQNPTVKVIAIDQDEENLIFAKNRLKPFGKRVLFFHSNFEKIKEVVKSAFSLWGMGAPDHRHSGAGKSGVDGILLDLGLSSPHVDNPARGFSFLREGPLDMRYDKSKGRTAEKIVNHASAQELQGIFSRYGEETEAKTVAEAIVKARQHKLISTTIELAEIIDNAKRFKKPGRSAATNVFQALRIEVNREFQVLEKVLEDALHLLAPGGRIVVISYHSLEDRIVKLAFKKYEAKGKKDKELQLIKLITKTPLVPTDEEIERNSRSRSAKMRVAEA